MTLRPPSGAKARKPTEHHLEQVIAQYTREYSELGRAAVDAIATLASESGPKLQLAEVEGHFARTLLPLLERTISHADLAVRIGASRVKRRASSPDAVDWIAADIVPKVVQARRAWILKAAKDFTHRVLVPALRLPAPPALRAAEGDDGPFGPGDFSVHTTETLTFTKELLDELVRAGYTFVKMRAVEATEHDVWKGDDLGFLRAAQAEGSMMFVWRTSPDELVCPICSELDGERFSAWEAEALSADRAIVSHCRCRCWFDVADD